MEKGKRMLFLLRRVEGELAILRGLYPDSCQEYSEQDIADFNDIRTVIENFGRVI